MITTYRLPEKYFGISIFKKGNRRDYPYSANLIIWKTIDIFAFDDSTIWNRLAKGIYYGHVRDSIKGTLKIWKWQKV